MQRDALQLGADIAGRDYRASALAFYGLSVVVVVNIALAGVFNPDRGETEFWIKLVIIFGGMLAWSLWIARRLTNGKGRAAAYSLLCILTGLVAIGALIGLTRGYTNPTLLPGMRVRSIARTASGVYLIVVWIVVIRDSIRSVGFGGRSTASTLKSCRGGFGLPK